MASFNGNLELLSLNGAQVFKVLIRTTLNECLSAYPQT